MIMQPPHNAELEEWKQAVWDYILEHCDVTPGGSIFVKFHTSGRQQLEGHIASRIKGYHRENPRDKEALHIEKQNVTSAEKRKKRDRWLADREQRRKLFAKVERSNNFKRASFEGKVKMLMREVIYFLLLRRHGRR